ncbi:hypothetical protein L9F63_000997, partial [Diploptera punctata]
NCIKCYNCKDLRRDDHACYEDYLEKERTCPPGTDKCSSIINDRLKRALRFCYVKGREKFRLCTLSEYECKDCDTDLCNGEPDKNKGDSAIRPVLHGPGLPLPIPPDHITMIEELSDIQDLQNDSDLAEDDAIMKLTF